MVQSLPSLEALASDYGIDLKACKDEFDLLVTGLQIPTVNNFDMAMRNLSAFTDLTCASQKSLAFKQSLGFETDITKFPTLIAITQDLSVPVLNILRNVVADTVNRIYNSQIYDSNMDLEIAIDLFSILPEYRDSVLSALQLIVESLYCDTSEWSEYNENQRIIFKHYISLALLKGALHTCGFTERDSQ